MNKEEILQLLKDNITIKLEFDKNNNYLTVNICVDGEDISSAYICLNKYEYYE